VSAVNTNGESLDSAEVSGMPQPASVFGFEAPAIGLGNYQYSPSGGPWMFNDASPNGSGIVANGSGFGNPNAPEGVQAAFVQELGTVSQSLAGFVPGTNYTITFSAAERGGNSQSWDVEIDNTVLGSYNPGSSASSYADYTASFTATAAIHTLSFVGTDLAGGDNTIFIDNVRITPPLLPVTLPATAADVVGDQIAFAAVFNGINLVYQWQKIKSGVTNNIAGATNTTLTLSNLQLTDTASYQLVASNANGVAGSTPSSLTVSSVPAAVNNVVTAMAAQTGASPGSSFTPTWTLAPNSLIADESPSATNGDFNLEPYWDHRSVNSLTAGGSLTIATGGSPTTTSTNYVACGDISSEAASLVVYTLTGSASGYNLTNIMVYGGWRDSGRDQQGYTVYYSTVAAPSNFISLGSVSYNPANAASVACATRATLVPANGSLATNVAAVEFNFTTPTTPNGWCGYSQIQVFGIPTSVTATNSTNIMFQVAGNNLTLNWPADHIGWTLQVQTNGLATNWLDVANSTTTNRMSFLITTTNGSIFYRMIYP
jgi:hypothetical protein